MKKKIICILVIMLFGITAISTLATSKKDVKTEKSQTSLSIEILEPVEGNIYWRGKTLHFPMLPRAIIIKEMTFSVQIESDLQIECVWWYVNGVQVDEITSPPYDWHLGPGLYTGKSTVKAEIIDFSSNTAFDTVDINKFL